MIRSQVVTKLAFSALIAGAVASSSVPANALPHLSMHSHPADPDDSRVVLDLYNKGPMFREVTIDGKTYTVLPGHFLTIKAPRGTRVFTNSTGSLHRKGDLLFAVDPSMTHKVLLID